MDSAIVWLLMALVAFIIYYKKRTVIKDISKDVVLITGGGSGIGREMALLFSKQGSTVVLWDIRPDLMEEVAKAIEKNNGKCYCFVCDVSNSKMVYETANKVKEQVGIVDILVNNAGIAIGKLLLELEDKEIIQTINVNLLSNFWTIKAFLPDMIKRDKGHVVTISSGTAFIGVPRLSDYAVSKCASLGLHENLRLELLKMKSKVNATVVCPALIKTGMFEGWKTSTSMRILAPALDPKEVAQEVIEAVKTNQIQLLIPGSLKFLLLLKAILPWSIADYLAIKSGSLDAMDTYKGRGLNWAMQKKEN